MNRIRILFSKGTLLNRLLRKYAVIMIGVTMTATIIFSVHTWNQNQLVGDSEKIENVTTYLTKPIDQYLMYVYEQQNSTDELVSFPNQIKDLYINYEELSAVYIVLNQLPEYYESSRENKGGEVKAGTPKLLDAFYIKLPITQGGAESGSIFIGFQKKELDTILENLTSFNGLSLYMISGTTNRLYTFHDNKIAKETFGRQETIISESLQKNSQLPIANLRKNNFIQHQELSDDYRILAVLDKKSVKIETGKNLAPLIVGIIVLDSILLIFLYKTFKRYSQQISIVMQAMEQTAAGNLETRIDTTKTEYELKELSIGINEMLDSINQFVEDIYKLEIKQQDAHMRALQAQINPHFLYNTLEYIRMYAISEGSEELADVVYAFSALLRNNTNQEKTITLKEELDFCEKYVYLYQMRYPNRVAYHFMIDPDLEKIEVPKFVIQPLVENYFKHGIDFTRFDNALSVKVLQEDKRVRIIVKDNGRGMTEKRLKQVEEKLSHPKVELHESIGLQNVNERLRANFGSSYYMSLENNETGGLTVSITFKEG